MRGGVGVDENEGVLDGGSFPDCRRYMLRLVFPNVLFRRRQTTFPDRVTEFTRVRFVYPTQVTLGLRRGSLGSDFR